MTDNPVCPRGTLAVGSVSLDAILALLTSLRCADCFGFGVLQSFLYALVAQKRLPEALPDGVLHSGIVRVFGWDQCRLARLFEQLPTAGGLLPEEWRLNRRIGASRLDESLHFADLEDPRAATLLRREMSPLLTELGLDDFDFSDLMGRDRRVTQNAARCVYEATDEANAPVFDGIRYVSRLNPGWELWAVFAARMVHEPEDLYQRISRDDSDLRNAAEVLDIEVE